MSCTGTHSHDYEIPIQMPMSKIGWTSQNIQEREEIYVFCSYKKVQGEAET